MPNDPLVAINDPDHAKFLAQDPEFFLTAAGEEVRKYCGWHLAPNKQEVGVRREINRDGVVLLKSMHVTAVTSVSVGGRTLLPSEYEWEECGLIYRTGTSWPRYLGTNQPTATVTFSHGWDDLPMDIKGVVFELAERARELPAGVVSQIGTGGFNYGLSKLGLILDDDQKDRLNNYRIVSF